MKKTLLSLILGLGILSHAGAQTTILSEDFEGGVFPATWSQTTLATDGGWLVGDSAALASSSFPFPVHTLFAGTNDDACNCDKSNDLMQTPSMDFSSYSNVFLSFDALFIKGTYQAKTESALIVASTNGGANWITIDTIQGYGNWITRNVNLSSLAGNASVIIGFKYNDGAGWLYGWGVDNVLIYEPVVGLDLGVSSTIVGKNDPRPAFVGFSKYLTSLPLGVKTTVDNLGTVAITSFDYSWTDGIATYSQSITGVNIAPLKSYTFLSPSTYVTLAGNTTITSSVTNINGGASELSTSNNSSTFDVNGVTPNSEKMYFIEEGTGTWCGWCPRGTVFMEYMRATYPNQFVGVAVHNADPMTITAYDAGMGTLISGYPSSVSNRTDVIDPSDMEADFIDKITTAPPVVISGTATLNLGTNQITVDLSGTFNQNLSGDYRYMAVLAEDSVSGTSTTWAQTNYYSANAQGPMGGFQSLAATVPAASMKYYFVNRALLGTFNGQTGSIPATIVSGTPYTYTFPPVTKLAAWVPSRMYVAAVVLDNATGAVLNAVKMPLTVVTGLNNDHVGTLKGSYIFPTLTSDNVNLSLSLEKSSNVSVTVTDVLGKQVLSQDLGLVQSGTTSSVWDVNNLSAGVYYLNIATAGGKMTQKFIKQ